MLRRTVSVLSYQRGGWGPGTKHQKHMMMNPTTYMYRFPGPHGPGPYTMKYWWTLGVFPTGLDTPFRLNEFLSSYKQQHVPIEVEEWLSCFLHDPVTSLQDASVTLCELLEGCAVRENTRGFTASEQMIKPLLEPLKKFEEQLGIRVPPIAVRSAMGKSGLRERLMNDLYDYNESIQSNGSTPHRRLACLTFEEDAPLLEASHHTFDNLTPSSESSISPELAAAVGSFSSVPSTTADDEIKLVRLMTTLAEGCAEKGHYDDSYSLLSSSLFFAHDENSQSAVHSNASIAALLDGNFDDAAYHSREAALLIPEPRRAPKAAARGYQLWATATAYQDDFDRAESIINDALALLPDEMELAATKQKITELKAGRLTKADPTLRRSHMLKSQQKRGILHGSGTGFDNEFDWIVFKNKLYPPKMNPSNNEMGSVFRRVGDLGGMVSTSRTTELL